MFTWWMLAGSALSCLVVLYLVGRRNERQVRRDWETLLTSKGADLYRTIEGRVRSEMGLADLTYEHAHVYRELGTIDEAIRLLDVGYQIIEKFSPSMLRLLSAMATFSRMVSAIAPVRPLRPGDFKVTQIASLAYLNGILHQFLVSAGERFRLKTYILGRSFGLATRFLLRSTRNLVERRPQADQEWEQIESIRHDFQTLTDESLESLKVLLTSLASDEHAHLLKQIR